MQLFALRAILITRLFINGKRFGMGVFEEMKKLILAILGVFCLQLGFIAYHSSDPAAETSFLVVDERASDHSLAANVPQPPILPQTIAELEPEFFEDAPDYDLIGRTADVRAVYSTQTARYIPRRRPALNTFVSENNLEDLRPVNVTYRLYDGVEFKPQPARARTEYPRAMPERAPRNYELNTKIAPRHKKKGFFAKSLTIVKKPYDWLKAIGSTLK